MRFPTKVIEFNLFSNGVTADFSRGFAIKRCMNTSLVVIIPELSELPLQINRVPENNVIKEFTANRSYSAFNKKGGLAACRARSPCPHPNPGTRN